jgi:hypothetical protein
LIIPAASSATVSAHIPSPTYELETHTLAKGAFLAKPFPAVLQGEAISVDKRWRYSPLGRIRCEQDAHEDDEAEDEDEDEDESKSEDEEGEGEREVFFKMEALSGPQKRRIRSFVSRWRKRRKTTTIPSGRVTTSEAI